MKHRVHLVLALPAILLTTAICSAAFAAPKQIVDLSKPESFKLEKVAGTTAARDSGSVLKVACPAGNGYPGVTFSPAEGTWDLSGCTHAVATVHNPNDHDIRVHMRVDNAGDWRQSPWSVGAGTIPAGETADVKIRFGYAYNGRAFALDPSKVVRILLYLQNPKSDVKFELVGLKAIAEEIQVAVDPKARPVPKSAADVSGTIKAPALPPIPGKWTATFEENFEGDMLDSTKWKVAQHWAGINGGAQPHQDNIAVDRDVLWLTWDLKDKPFSFGDKTNVPYGTGEVTTFKRFHQKYGYWECRMKYDVMRTCWPAFWLFPASRPTDQLDEMKWAYVKFDLADVPAKAAQATLHVKVESAPQDYWFDVFRCPDDSWSESTLTWKNKPTFDAAFLDHVNPAPPAGSWVEVDVTDFVNREVAGDRKATFVLAEMLQQKWNIAFCSSEADEADRPYLAVDGKKIPATEDTYVYAAKPEANFGAEKTLEVTDQYGYICSTYDGGMEVDILESIGIWGPDKTLHALHWDGYGKDHQHIGRQVTDLKGLDQTKWTTVGLYWEEGKLEFYVNGTKTWTYTDPRVGSVPAFMLLSAQTGGWGGNSDMKETVFEPSLPRHMYVDYVKVWSGKKAE